MMTSHHSIPPPAKKAKCETSWRSWRGEFKANNGKRFGLKDLLPGFTLRLEHREGGALSTHRGEERILLFRSDKPGAIAKIIYSSEIEDDQTSLQSSVAELQKNNVAHAKIHVLDVKSQYRGRDLGGLLFSEALTHLKSKYCNYDENYDDFDVNEPLKSDCKEKQLYDVKCSLEAEEDVTRHGKLIDFYTRLGCHVASKRVQYMNDNDFAYRKVPMQCTLKATATTTLKDRKRSVLMCNTPFLPVQLVGDAGKLTVKSGTGGSAAGIKFDWLIKQTDDGIVFSSTHGHVLYASPSGNITIFSPDDQTSDSDIESWSIFVPIHITDGIDDRDETAPQPDSSRSLWVFRSCHGTFLTADSASKHFSCTKLPTFWQANGSNLRLACVSDTPPRRHHYLQCWKLQTHDYVQSMRSRFLNFSLGKATLFEALGWIHAFPAYPFHAWSSDDTIESSTMVSSPSLRTLSFLMAEAARDEGLPDWVQLVALIHELGEAVKNLDPNNTGKMAESIYDWTISTRSRVVGCPVPDCATFSEFRHLNADSLDVRYNTDTGVYESNCGLDSVLLVWSGAEFMYHLLRHNSTALSMEALAMVRYFLLGDWHEHHEYTSITNEYDNDMLPWVKDFDRLRRKTRLECLDCVDLSDEQCTQLWESHYSRIAAKYDCDQLFEW